MDEIEELEFKGFSDVALQPSLILSWIYTNVVEKFEWNTNTCTSTPNQKAHNKMEFSLSKCYADAVNSTNCSNISCKGIIIDNDSGYVSQNIESNSSVDIPTENRSVLTEGLNVQNVYVNEDTLLEQPQSVSRNQFARPEDGYEEFDHLFYMKESCDNVVNSSVVSQSTTFSGLEEDDSKISNVSGTIPIATPIILPSNVISDSFDNNSSTSKSNVGDNFLPCITNNSEPFEQYQCENTHSNFGNTSDVKFEELSQGSVKEKLNSTFEENRNNLSSIQSRIMDAHNCDMSLFESFYTFVCDLYTRNDMSLVDLANVSVNPRSLQLNNTEENDANIPKSPSKTCYVELQTKRTIDYSDKTTSDNVTNVPLIQQESCAADELKKQKEQAIEVCPVLNNNTDADKLIPMDAPATPVKQFKNPVNTNMSPDLFSDEEPPESLSQSFTQVYKACEKLYVLKNDRLLLKRAQGSLCGVPPPPSLTVSRLSAEEMLQKIKDNQNLFMTSENNTNSIDHTNEGIHKVAVSCDKGKKEVATKKQSLLITCNNKDDVSSQEWPAVVQYRYHGLHHNRSKYNEDFEHLCLKYAERYIGAETQSSCTVFGIEVASPSKRKYRLKRPGRSPGKRLSHLARRRITFSKESLQSVAGPSSSSFIGARTRQIMVDARKMELLSRRRSPRKRSPRKTPGKSPRRGKSPRKRTTPSSSAKKRFEMRLRTYSSEENMDVSSVSSASSSRAAATKRALFQSPPNKAESARSLLDVDSSSCDSFQRRTPRRALFPSPFKVSPSKLGICSLYPAKRKLTPKRALFKSPPKSSPKFNETYDSKKRKRIDADDEQPKKISRSISISELNNSSSRTSRAITRSSSSSSIQSQDIAEHRKKKLMWAVAEALRSQNVDLKHPQFKVFASVLARVIRYFLPNLFTKGPRPEGSTTENMLRIARQHVFAVTRGKTVDQIIKDAEKKVIRVPKPSGYVGLDKLQATTDVGYARNKENILQDKVNIIDGSENYRLNKGRHGENVERIRRVINFGDEEDNRNNSAVR